MAIAAMAFSGWTGTGMRKYRPVTRYVTPNTKSTLVALKPLLIMSVATIGAMTPISPRPPLNSCASKRRPDAMRESERLSGNDTSLPESPVIARQAEIVDGVHVEATESLRVELRASLFAEVLDPQAR